MSAWVFIFLCVLVLFLLVPKVAKRPEATGIQEYETESDEEERAAMVELWKESLQTLWTGSFDAHFAYKWGGERTRRDVRIERIVEDEGGEYFFYGWCALRGDYRHFNTQKISSKVKVPSKGRFYHSDELVALLLGREEKQEYPEAKLAREIEEMYAWENDIPGLLRTLLKEEPPVGLEYTRRAAYGVIHAPGNTRQWLMRLYSYMAYEKPKFWIEPYGGEKFTMFAGDDMPEAARLSLVARMTAISRDLENRTSASSCRVVAPSSVRWIISRSASKSPSDSSSQSKSGMPSSGVACITILCILPLRLISPSCNRKIHNTERRLFKSSFA